MPLGSRRRCLPVLPMENGLLLLHVFTDLAVILLREDEIGGEPVSDALLGKCARHLPHGFLGPFGVVKIDAFDVT